MNKLDFSTITPQVPSAERPLFVISGIIAAQRAGDADYDWCIERGMGGEMAAIAYHLAYQRLARQPGGCGPVCGCNLCRDEFGVKGSAL